MSDLLSLIQDEIRESGPMSFARFMELALYHFEWGYYRKAQTKTRVGREGDFITSVSVGPLFGRLLARQFLQMWELLGKPDPFWVIEAGAEDGQLAVNLLTWCRAEAAPFFKKIRYALIEPSLPQRAAQEENLKRADLMEKALWFDQPEDLAAQKPVGIFFSNELFDALPVHVVTCQAGRWQERRVGLNTNGGLEWICQPITEHELANAVRALSLPLLEGYTTEIKIAGAKWMQRIGLMMERGYVLTIDYGFPSELYYAPFRGNGTLTAYKNQSHAQNVLESPGDQDITAHVDFTALARAGEKAGLTTLGFLDQEHFLIGIAQDELSGVAGPQVDLASHLRQWNTLIHPNHFGTRFHALLQAKAAPRDLIGLRFAKSSIL